MINIQQQGKGGLIQKVSLKDYRLEVVPGAVVLPSKFSLRDKVGKIKQQNGSSSCSSQATSYYAEVLNFIETGEKVQLSPKFLYPFVCYPYEGSYVKDNFARVCDWGIALESDIPSYENGNPPSEAWMIQKPQLSEQILYKAMTYWAKKYLTWDNANIDLYKKAIAQGNGCVAITWGNNPCWQTGNIEVPIDNSQMTWRHAIYIIGWDDSKKVFEFVNSWGEEWGDKGFGWLPYEYVTKGYLANPMTLIDMPNNYYNLLRKLIGLYKNLVQLLLKK